MKLECCGKPVRTPFCPLCGAEISSSFGLSIYLTNEINKCTDQIERLAARIELPEQYFKSRVTLRKELATWKLKETTIMGWLDWVSTKQNKD